MKFPTLSFELDIIKKFLSSENKFSWFIQQFKMDFNGDTQVAIIFMIGFALFSLFIVLDAEKYSYCFYLLRICCIASLAD
jgi:hypothetical protein